jgi:hypothetical protein
MNVFPNPVSASLFALLLGGALRGGIYPPLVSTLFDLREQDGLTGQAIDFAKICGDFSHAQTAVMGERTISQS